MFLCGLTTVRLPGTLLSNSKLGNQIHSKCNIGSVLKGLISEIIIQALDMGKALQKIEETANQLPVFDKVKFVEAVETELLSIHDGNFARYMARPSEYKKWRVVWTGL